MGVDGSGWMDVDGKVRKGVDKEGAASEEEGRAWKGSDDRRRR